MIKEMNSEIAVCDLCGYEKEINPEASLLDAKQKLLHTGFARVYLPKFLIKYYIVGKVDLCQKCAGELCSYLSEKYEFDFIDSDTLEIKEREK